MRTEIYGPFEVQERLGIGGMATVHRAIERSIDGFERVVAIKRLLPHLAEDEAFVRAFVREAKLASLLQHSNIVQLYELGRVGASYFISMEYIAGCDLRVILRQARRMSGPPPVEITIAILIQLLDALDYAHNLCSPDGKPLGLVHRDVSPSNVIVSNTGHVKIIDFGIAKATIEHLMTNTGRIKGKLPYMAPEALTSRIIDSRSDLFSASVVAHELLTATPLFAAKDDFHVIDRLHNMQAPPPSARNPNCPHDLDDIVLRGLAKERDRRWRSAADMRAALADLAVSQRRLATARDISDWIEEAFGSPLPSRLRLPFEPPSDAATESRRGNTTGIQTDERVDEELVAFAWGATGPRRSVPFVLDDVPDVSGELPAARSGPLELPAKPADNSAHRPSSAVIVPISRTGDRLPEVEPSPPPARMTSTTRQTAGPDMPASGSWPPTREELATGLLEEAVLAARRAEALAMAAVAKQRRRSMVQLVFASAMIIAAGLGAAWIVSGGDRRAHSIQVASTALEVEQRRAAGQQPEAHVRPLTAPVPGASASFGTSVPASAQSDHPPARPASLAAAPVMSAALPEASGVVGEKPDDEAAGRADERTGARKNDRNRGGADARVRTVRPWRDSARDGYRDLRQPDEGPGRRRAEESLADRNQDAREQEEETVASQVDTDEREDRKVASTLPERPTPERPTPERPTPERPTPERPTPERPTPERPTIEQEPVRPMESAKIGGMAAVREFGPLPVQIGPPVTGQARIRPGAPTRPREPLLVPPNRTQREGGTLRPIRFPGGEQPPPTIVAKLCIDPGGSITSVTVLTPVSPGVRTAVQRYLSQLRYRPVVEAGEKVAACFASGFPVRVQ